MTDIENGNGRENSELNRVLKIIDELKNSSVIKEEAFEVIRGLIYHPISLEGMNVDETDKIGDQMQILASELSRHGWEELADQLTVGFHKANPGKEWFDVEIEQSVSDTRNRAYHIPRLNRSEPEGAFLDAICYTVLPRLQELDRSEDLSMDTGLRTVVTNYIVPWLEEVDASVLSEAQVSELKRVIPGIIEELERLNPFIIHSDFVPRLEKLLDIISSSVDQ